MSSDLYVILWIKTKSSCKDDAQKVLNKHMLLGQLLELRTTIVRMPCLILHVVTLLLTHALHFTLRLMLLLMCLFLELSYHHGAIQATPTV